MKEKRKKRKKTVGDLAEFQNSSDAINDWARSQTVENIGELLQSVAHFDLPLQKRKILAVARLPQTIGWTVAKKATHAGVSESYWYRCFAEPEFRKLCVTAARELFGNKVLDLTNKYIERALNGDAVAAATILRQCGVLDKEEKGDNVTNVNIAIVEQEREEKLKKGLNRFGYTVNTDN